MLRFMGLYRVLPLQLNKQRSLFQAIQTQINFGFFYTQKGPESLDTKQPDPKKGEETTIIYKIGKEAF